MKKILFSIATLVSTIGNAQFSQSDLIYYIGQGPDTAVLVVDFLDGTPDSSYAWGYLFDASQNVQASTMLADIAADEPKLTVTASTFLSDIVYNSHQGIGGSPNYWGTWTKTASTAWAMNGGIGDTLQNGMWFGCSYTDFSPAVAPGEPIPAYDSKKWSPNNVEFWVGSGTDSAVLVVDFVQGTYGSQATYSWGVLFSDSTTGGEMLEAVANADVNFDINMTTFLNDITFNDLAGIGGSPNYWGTFSGTNLTDWTLNSGIGEVVKNGDWFGTSYASWPPRRPFYPIAALDSSSFTANNVNYWVGTGADSAVIVIDFNGADSDESFAFGYLFSASDNKTASDALQAISSAEPALDVAIAGSFLNNITYMTYAGIGGSPYYWSTWSATNVGSWTMNSGIGDTLQNGSWFGCSYMNWSPATPPSLPVSGTNTTSLTENTLNVNVFPNPMKELLHINLEEKATITLRDMNGRVVLTQNHLGTSVLNVAHLNAGMYILEVTSSSGRYTQKVIK